MSFDTTIVLSVSPHSHDHAALESALAPQGITVLRAGNYRDACASLARYRITAVICEQSLRDGCWQDVLSVLQQSSETTCFIATAESPSDRLWAEVLNLGGFDVLAKPFDCGEVSGVVASACRQEAAAAAA